MIGFEGLMALLPCLVFLGYGFPKIDFQPLSETTGTEVKLSEMISKSLWLYVNHKLEHRAVQGFKKCKKNLDLRCVFHPAPLHSVQCNRYWVKTMSQIQYKKV